MKQLILLLTIVISSFASAQKNITELERKGETWTEKGQKTPYTGTFVEYFDNGVLKGTGAFKKGIPDGARVMNYESGKKKTETNYRAGLQHGAYTEYYETGQIKQQGQFADGKSDGTWKMYYADGKPQAVLNFVKGVENGDYFEYDSKGKLKSQYYITNGETGYAPEFTEVTQKAALLAKQGKAKEAIELYDKAVQLNPTVAKVYHNRGVIKANLLKYEEAIADYNIALEIDPEYKEAYANRGVAKINIFNSTHKIGEKPTAEEGKSACEDFHKAVSLGDKSVNTEDMIFLYCKKK